MPDPTLSAAIKEAYASDPKNVVYPTLEINHDSFTQPIRVVRDKVNLVATLEDTAPLNPGESVEFIAYQFNLVKPEIGPSGVPQCTIEIDNISREILAQIDAAVSGGSQNLITVTYREYLDSNVRGGAAVAVGAPEMAGAFYQSAGAPAGSAVPFGVYLTDNGNGTFDILVSWERYADIAPLKADYVLLFTRADAAPPSIQDTVRAFMVNRNRAYFLVSGVPAAEVRSIGIAAARSTENGLEIGEIKTGEMLGENFIDDISVWGATADRVLSGTHSPDGSPGYTLTDNNVLTYGYTTSAYLPYVGGDVCLCDIFIAKDTVSDRVVLLRCLSYNGASYLDFRVRTDTGEYLRNAVGSAVFTSWGIYDFGDWWRVRVAGSVGVGGATFRVRFYPAIGPDLTSNTVATTGSATIAGANLFKVLGTPPFTLLNIGAGTANYPDSIPGPENDPPLKMVLSDIVANPFRIKAVAGFPNMANRRFPSDEYTAEVFPGLVNQ
jgi:hypothetical protein